MCIKCVFHQLNNIISFDFSTLFDYFNLALSHSLNICVPLITLINELIINFPSLILSLLTRGQGRLKGGANRAIARGPTFWGAHKLFEKHFFTIY